MAERFKANEVLQGFGDDSMELLGVLKIAKQGEQGIRFGELFPGPEAK